MMSLPPNDPKIIAKYGRVLKRRYAKRRGRAGR
jgi:hypothetical protein